MKEQNDKNEITPEEIDKRKSKKLSVKQNIFAYSLLTVFSAVFIVCAVIIADYLVDVVRERKLHDELGTIGSILEDTGTPPATPVWTRPVYTTQAPDVTEAPSDDGTTERSPSDSEIGGVDSSSDEATTNHITPDSSVSSSVESTTAKMPDDDPEIPSVENTTVKTPDDDPEIPSVENTTAKMPDDDPEIPSVENTTAKTPDDDPELPSVENTTAKTPTDSDEPTEEVTTKPVESDTTTAVVTTPPVTTTTPVTAPPVVLPESPPIPEDNGSFSEKFRKIREELFALNAQNPDIFGYISIPCLGISYPLVHRPSDSTNLYYLTHNEKGQSQKAGSIYADYRINREPSSNKNLVIYGHNMRSGSMFGTLSKLITSKKLFEEAEIIIATFYGIYTYKVFSTYRTDAYDPYCSMYFANDTEYGKFLNEIAAKSSYPSPITDLSPADRIITLSTCTNMTETGRYAVHGVLIKIEQ